MGLDEKTYVDALRICKEQAKKLADVNGGTLVVIPQPVSKSMVKYSSNTGGNPLGLTARAQLCKFCLICDAKAKQICH